MGVIQISHENLDDKLLGTADRAKYKRHNETEKPEIILVHEPGAEARLAVEHPNDWGFDPSLSEYQRSFEYWLEDAQGEHQQMVSVLRNNDISVLFLNKLLEQNYECCKRYLSRQFKRVEEKIEKFDKKIKRSIHKTYEIMMDSPVSGLILGLESCKSFRQLPYDTKFKVYKDLKTLMPQTSLYFMRDSVIPCPGGLVKPRMSMWSRKQEAEIVELALGKESYVYRLKNVTEGGDVIMFSYMVLGISRASGRGIIRESEKLAGAAQVKDIILFFMPDYFEPKNRYKTGNVMHIDTLLMPVDDDILLSNSRMLKKTKVIDNKLTVDGYEWAKKHFDRIIEVPDNEQQGIHGWGTNVLPLGNKKILSSAHLNKTNRNLKKEGFTVIGVETETLIYGFGNIHCMTAYLK